MADLILAQVGEGRRLDVAWEALGGNESAARPWLRHLVYGTVRLQGRLDHLIGHFARRAVDTLDDPVQR
ncbi:MAG: hypothetical protein OEO23_16070, partial [Gemmatimonadota bacterium]|nr:hypothetical protein [Gemmatimonadota bacterium]